MEAVGQSQSGNLLVRLANGGLSHGEAVYARLAVPLGIAIFSAYVLLTALTAVVRPDANWDMLPYLAVAEESEHPDAAALHDYVYGTIREGVSEADYRALVDDGGGFRSHMADNAEDFHSLLGMYRVKFLYAELLSGLSTFMPPVAAMRAVSVFSALAFGAVVLVWLRAYGALALAPVMAGFLMVMEFSDLARAATPDLLCGALMLGALLAYVTRREAAAGLLIFLAFMVRPDNIVFIAVFAFMLIVFGQRSWGVLAGAAASLAGYFVISAWAGHPGWWPHLYFSSVEQQLNMNGFDPAFSIAAYGKAFANAVVRALTFNSWLGIVLLSLAGWFVAARAGFRLESRAGVLFAALLFGLAAKFVVFPIHDTRVYFPSLAPLVLLLVGPFVAFWGSRQVKAPAAKKG